MKRVILHVPNRARFHFGNVALGENMSLAETAILPHSDTLFSAIIRTANLFAPDHTDELVAAFADGRVTLSSGNFCLETPGNQIYFLPKPAHAGLWSVPDDRDRKALHRIQFISERVWLAGFTPTEWLEEQHCRQLPGGFVVTVAEAEGIPDHFSPYRKLNLPKVRVHDTTREDGFFNQISVQLMHHETCRTHYYFLLRDEALEAPLDQILRTTLELLPDQGIGGERRVGCGHIDAIHFETASELDQLSSDYSVALALISPRDQDELAACYRYQPILRGGRRIAATGTSEVSLKRVRLLREGAVTEPAVTGRLADIKPEQGADVPFLRAGRHFPVSLHPNLAAHVN